MFSVTRAQDSSLSSILWCRYGFLQVGIPLATTPRCMLRQLVRRYTCNQCFQNCSTTSHSIYPVAWVAEVRRRDVKFINHVDERPHGMRPKIWGQRIHGEVGRLALLRDTAGVEIILPVDFTCSSKFGEDGEIKEGRDPAKTPPCALMFASIASKSTRAEPTAGKS